MSSFSEEIKLRHVETDVLIPKMMREKAKERCAEKVVGKNITFFILPSIVYTNFNKLTCCNDVFYNTYMLDYAVRSLGMNSNVCFFGQLFPFFKENKCFFNF